MRLLPRWVRCLCILFSFQISLILVIKLSKNPDIELHKIAFLSSLLSYLSCYFTLKFVSVNVGSYLKRATNAEDVIKIL